MAVRQVCTFRLDGALYGVDVRDVQEVLRGQRTTPVPLAPAVVRGLMNLRGQIVAAIDLRLSLGIAPRAEDVEAMNVVVRGPDGPTALLVDEIGDVLEVTDEESEPPPDTLEPRAREFVERVCKLERGLLTMLRVERAARAAPAPAGSGA